MLLVTILFTTFTLRYIHQVRQATLNRKGGRTTAKITIGEFLNLDILVENMGRVNYGPQLRDRKGIFSNVTLGGEILGNWTIYRIDLDSVVKSSLRLSSSHKKETKNSGRLKILFNNLANEANEMPAFYEGVIPAAPDGVPKDTFLRLKGWTKVRFTYCHTLVSSPLGSSRLFYCTCLCFTLLDLPFSKLNLTQLFSILQYLFYFVLFCSLLLYCILFFSFYSIFFYSILLNFTLLYSTLLYSILLYFSTLFYCTVLYSTPLQTILI